MAINFHNSIKLNKNQLIQGAIENVLTDYDASASVSGQLVFNTTDAKIKVYDEALGAWKIVGETYTASTGIAVSSNAFSLKNNANFTGGALLKWDATNGQLVDSLISDNGATVVIAGNLSVTGTTTTVNSTTVELGDNIILLNKGEANTPTANAGFEVERGTSDNVSFIWNETSDYFSTIDQKLHVGSLPDFGAVTGTSEILLHSSGEIQKLDISEALAVLQFVGDTGIGSIGATAYLAIQGAAGSAISTEVDGSALTIGIDKATTTAEGVVSFATDQETIDGTESAKATTPTGVAAAISDALTSTKYAQDLVGDASTVAFTVIHNLNTLDVLVEVYNPTSLATIFADVVRIDVNTLEVRFGSAPAVSENYRVVVRA